GYRPQSKTPRIRSNYSASIGVGKRERARGKNYQLPITHYLLANISSISGFRGNKFHVNIAATIER
ncbi:MAG: hypothetical protein ACKPE1_11400, partial [Dolichospermum sp.]